MQALEQPEILRAAPILVAEDEENDRVLLGLAFEEAGLGTPVVMVTDGKEAIAYLERALADGAGPGTVLPRLLVLDLKMRRCTGFEVLAWVTARPRLKSLPMVVFTSSNQQADRERALKSGAARYVEKPGSYPQLVAFVRELPLSGVTAPMSVRE